MQRLAAHAASLHSRPSKQPGVHEPVLAGAGQPLTLVVTDVQASWVLHVLSICQLRQKLTACAAGQHAAVGGTVSLHE